MLRVGKRNISSLKNGDTSHIWKASKQADNETQEMAQYCFFFSFLLRLERRSEGNKSNEDPPTYFWVVNHKKRDMVISRFNGKLRHRLCEPQGREVGEIVT